MVNKENVFLISLTLLGCGLSCLGGNPFYITISFFFGSITIMVIFMEWFRNLFCCSSTVNVKRSYKNYYFYQNLDSYILQFRYVLILAIYSLVYTAICFLPVCFGQRFPLVLFSVIYLYVVSIEFFIMNSCVRYANPGFRGSQFRLAVLTVGVVAACITFFNWDVGFDEFAITIFKIFIVLFDLVCLVINLLFYHKRFTDPQIYKVSNEDNPSGRETLRLYVKDKVFELRKDFKYLVITNSGDYRLIVDEGIYFDIPKEDLTRDIEIVRLGN